MRSTNQQLSSEISERKKTEEALERRGAELLTVNQELEAFSYSVSRDLRAPLRSIDGFSQALLEDYSEELDSHGEDFLQRVRGARQRMGVLIDDLLSLSRVTRQELNREELDLNALAQSVSHDLKKTHPDRDVEFIISDELVADGDPRLVRVVLENLLGTAWK